ncbi:MAG: DNA repair protein RecN [Bacteroidales bacterium]|nr:DNA repair protein RecN [Bacteroidales bacterium]
MIKSLSISNYALIRDIALELDPGFNVITGETGAGKSIILGALGLLQGKRADGRSVTTTDSKSVVEATFDMDPDTAAAVDALLADASVDSMGRSVALRREITPAGRSRALVNGQPVSLTLLRDIASLLVDIHSQHKNLLISDPAFQLSVLDNIADNADLIGSYHTVYAEYRKALRIYADTRDSIEATRADADYLQYQLDRLKAANLVAGEQADLEAQRQELESAASAGEHLVEAADALSWDDTNAVQCVDRAIAALSMVSDSSAQRASLLERLETLRVELADISDSVADDASSVREDPHTLEAIDARLSQLYALLSKHKAESVEELIATRDSLAERLDNLAGADTILASLKAEAVELKRRALAVAASLTERRTIAARQLERLLIEKATPLGLKNLNCEVRITTGKLNPDGADTVDYLFAFNKNQQLAPIGTTASGGEISRVMLVLKSILARHMHLPTIIFDEIDTGVSGDVASRMGNLMAEAGANMQVITITHLPQVAARGDAHFKVYKRDDDTSTFTSITRLNPDGRRTELAAMLSGRPDDPAALAAADSLLISSK